jgi:hypothetical protein
VAMILDTETIVAIRQGELLAEAERERLAARLPRAHSSVRHELASACVRLANWLDGATDDVPGAGQDGYVRGSKSGPSGWVADAASV